MASPRHLEAYIRYDELVSALRGYEAGNPGLVRLVEIGKSHEGRPIWMSEVTDPSTGPAEDKPAFWCDGNIHASEVSATTAVLTILHRLVEGWRAGDPQTVALLRERAFYLVPRLNPDGAEWALETPPRIVRSSTRVYPYPDDEPEGLVREDLDGDGRILTMRVPDPNGPWVVNEREPRLLRRRKPGERAAQAYRIMPEGKFRNFDGMTMRMRRRPQGLDMNRNFPSAWRQEHEQLGAGPYPTSEPEIRAAVQAIVERPNICGALTFHTFSGVLLRPPSRMPDDDIPAEDLWTYKALGDEGARVTGYPAISNYHEFRYHPKEVITGVFDDWMYEHRGVHAWTVEIWSPQRQAGIKDYKYIEWFRDHPPEDDEAILAWCDERLDGRGYQAWQPFDHPQLGPVEIGGWDFQLVFANPPPEFLAAEVGPLADWALWHAGTGPRLELRAAEATPAGGAWRVRVAVENAGWLPTCVTKLAEERKLCRGVRARIFQAGGPEPTGLERPAWLASGALEQDAGQLAGWSHVTAMGFGDMMSATDDVAVFEWAVSEPGEYRVVVEHERAGRVRANVVAGA